MTLSIRQIESQRGRDVELYETLKKFQAYVNQLEARVGVAGNAEPLPAGQKPLAAPDPPAGISVVGQDGHFKVTITPHANHAGKQVVYGIEAGDDAGFSITATLKVTTYGPDQRTYWDITLPNVTKYWRCWGQFAQSDKSTYVYFLGSCGPLGVNSGVLSAASAANRLQRSTNNAILNTQYIASGNALANGQTSNGTPTVNWAAFTIYYAGNTKTISVPLGKIEGLAANTKYFLAWDAATNSMQYSTQLWQTLPDTYFGISDATTPATLGGGGTNGGGGSDGGGGGGGCVGAGTLIDVERPDGSGRVERVPVEQLKLGDVLVSPLGKCAVRKVGMRPGQRLVRVRDGFRELICSSSHNLVLKPEQIDLMSVDVLDVTGPVYYVEAEEPHVYLANGILSHNKLILL